MRIIVPASPKISYLLQEWKTGCLGSAFKRSDATGFVEPMGAFKGLNPSRWILRGKKRATNLGELVARFAGFLFDWPLG